MPGLYLKLGKYNIGNFGTKDSRRTWHAVPAQEVKCPFSNRGRYLPQQVFSEKVYIRFTGSRHMASLVKLRRSRRVVSRRVASPRVAPAVLEKLRQRDQRLGHGVNGLFVDTSLHLLSLHVQIGNFLLQLYHSLSITYYSYYTGWPLRL